MLLPLLILVAVIASPASDAYDPRSSEGEEFFSDSDFSELSNEIEHGTDAEVEPSRISLQDATDLLRESSSPRQLPSFGRDANTPTPQLDICQSAVDVNRTKFNVTFDLGMPACH